MADDEEPQEVEVKFNSTIQFSDFTDSETKKIMKRNFLYSLLSIS